MILQKLSRSLFANTYLKRDMALLDGPQFNRDYYLSLYGEHIADGEDPVHHYLTSGHLQDFDPSPYFSSAQYRAANPALRKTGESPFAHYLRHQSQPATPPEGSFTCDEIHEMVITSDGDVTTCCVDVRNKNVFGNIYKDKFTDIRKKFRRIRYDIIKNPQAYPACADCQKHCDTAPDKLRFMKYCRTNPSAEALQQYLDFTEEATRSLRIEPSSVCTAKCTSCFLVSNEFYRYRKTRYIDFSALTAFLGAEVSEVNNFSLYFYGEPFAHSGIVHFIRRLSNTNPHAVVTISTNGISFGTDANMQELANAAYDMRIILVVSIHGSNAENTSIYMGEKHPFDQVMENVKHLAYLKRKDAVTKRLRIVWKYVLLEWNDSEEHIEEAIRKSGEYGFDALHFFLTKQPAPSRRIVLNSPAWHALAKRMKVLKDNVLEHANNLDAKPIGYFKSNKPRLVLASDTEQKIPVG